MEKILYQRYRELTPSIIEAQKMEFSPGPNRKSSTQVNKMIEAEVETWRREEMKTRAAADEGPKNLVQIFFDDTFTSRR